MRSARRRNRIETQKRKGRFLSLFFRFLLPLGLILAVFIFFRVTTRFWNGRDKFILVFREANGNVGVTVLDPAASEVTTITVPGDLEVVVSENYGTLRIKNVWQLSLNEKKGGRLLPETVMKNFLFPVFLWASEPGAGLGEGNFGNILKFVFSPGLTNISFGDRVMAALFALRVDHLGRTEIDLAKSQFVKKQILNDGTSGYKLSGPISERLTANFSDSDFSDKGLRVKIDDRTGRVGADKVGEILQVLGGKVVSIDRAATAEDSDCSVLGKAENAMKKVMNIFVCQKGTTPTDFDLELILGSKFAKRF